MEKPDTIRGRQRPGKEPRVEVSVYMTAEMARRLDARAEIEGRSRSDMARQLLESCLQPAGQRAAVGVA